MNGGGKSDGPIVPRKSANNGGGNRFDGSHPATPSAERAEGRGPAKGNSLQGTGDRAQDRATPQAALERIRQAARSAWPSGPKARARCGNSARRDLSGGHPARGVPTGDTIQIKSPPCGDEAALNGATPAARSPSSTAPGAR